MSDRTPPTELIEVPTDALAPETVRRLIEEFVTRSGTDYGTQEASLDRKVADVARQLDRGEVRIVYDPESQSCDLREALPKHRPFFRALDANP